MRKLTWRSAAVLALTTCFSSISSAQTAGSVEYYYAGPLDSFQTNESSANQGPLDVIAKSSEQLPRIARLTPPRNLRQVHAGVSETVVGPVSNETVFELAGGKFKPASIPKVQSVSPPNPVQVPTIPSQVTPIAPARPTFTEPTIQPGAFSRQPINVMNLPAPQDPTRFGYRDGEAFGFNNTRLYNPLDGPQLNLQGAPTVDFGAYGCDEWQGFCRANELDQNCGCGGLKVNPGHLGLPWLGSKDNCDQTIPFERKRPCQKCQTAGDCDSCSSCSHE